MRTLFHDLRYGARLLLRSPGFKSCQFRPVCSNQESVQLNGSFPRPELPGFHGHTTLSDSRAGPHPYR